MQKMRLTFNQIHRAPSGIHCVRAGLDV